jgi:AraC-like DNA-binding protein
MTTNDHLRLLIQSAKQAASANKLLPFSVYSSFKEQKILNAPIVKPLLIFVLDGVKKLGKNEEIICQSDTFLFLSNTTNIDMRNIPSKEYLAVLIEFEHSDFDQFGHAPGHEIRFIQGKNDNTITKTLHQYIEFGTFSKPEIWHFRRKELLHLLYISGYKDVSRMIGQRSFCHQLHDIISEDFSADWNVDRLASRLALSPATLRRRIKAEGEHVHSVVERIRLGHGLYLVQTTMDPIGRISEVCGYQSQSRFTDKFKQLFGITPSELRKTRMPVHRRGKVGQFSG